MDRKKFIETGLILGGTSLLPSSSVFSQNLIENNIDKLVDAEGNYIQQPLL